MKNIIKILIVFIFSLNTLNAQEILSSKTYINTCYNEQQCFSLNSASFIFYNNDNHELSFSIDFSKFKTGNDTIDSWLDDLDDTKLTFKGELIYDNLLVLTNHNSKAVVVNGLMTFNGVSHSHKIEVTIFEVSREGVLFQNNQQDYNDRINVNLGFSFMPKEFKIDKKPHHLKKKITVGIYRGYVNKYNSRADIYFKN